MRLPKPSACQGCPAFGDGTGFVPDEIVEGAEVAVCGQNPGEYEENGTKIVGYESGQPVIESHPHAPYLGPTGYVMEKQYFPVAGLARGSVTVLNAMRCRWNHTDTMRPLKSPEQRAAIDHCTRAHQRLPASTRLIVAEGEYALWALTRQGLSVKNSSCKYDGCECKAHTIGAWRGYVLPYVHPLAPPPVPLLIPYQPTPNHISVLATYHIAYLFHAPWDSGVARADWAKVPSVLRGMWPQPVPAMLPSPPSSWPAHSAFDTEFDPLERLVRYSLAYGTMVRVVEAEDVGPRIAVPPPITAKPRVIMHNAEADVPYLRDLLYGDVDVEDTMYKHAVLWPGLEHNLGFVGSLYGVTNRWKHLVHVNPRVYAGLDAWNTLHIDAALTRELAQDSGSHDTYYKRMLPLIPILAKLAKRGIRVNAARAARVAQELAAQQVNIVRRAQAAAGWPINIGSPAQVARWLYFLKEKY